MANQGGVPYTIYPTFMLTLYPKHRDEYPTEAPLQPLIICKPVPNCDKTGHCPWHPVDIGKLEACFSKLNGELDLEHQATFASLTHGDAMMSDTGAGAG